METLRALAQSLGIAYAAGLNLYATVAILGLADRLGWIDDLPAGIEALGSAWVITLAGILYLFEFAATMIPGVASAWETFHSLVRPPAAAALAAVVVWSGDAHVIVAAALLGGGIALTTHGAKLGLRYAIDASPEPATNAAANVAELGIVGVLVIAIWHYPLLSLAVALVLLVVLVAAVRRIWRALRQVFSGHWAPAAGFLQSARCGPAAARREDREED